MEGNTLRSRLSGLINSVAANVHAPQQIAAVITKLAQLVDGTFEAIEIVNAHFHDLYEIMKKEVQSIKVELTSTQATVNAKVQEMDAKAVWVTTETGNKFTEVDNKVNTAKGEFDTLHAELTKEFTKHTGKVQEMERYLLMVNNAKWEERIKRLEEDIQKGKGSGKGQGGFKKGIMEYKVISNLKMLGSDRTHFRTWNDKFINALMQVNGDYGEFMEELNKKLDGGEKYDFSGNEEVENFITDAGLVITLNPEEIQMDLFAVLKDKTEGEAETRMKSVKRGKGMDGYCKIYKWFTGTTGMGLAEKAKEVMHPKPPKEEGDIADALDKWVELERALSNHKGYGLAVQYKMVALESLMVGKAKDQFDTWKETMEGSESEESFRKLVNKAREYATKKRLESNMKKGIPMDIGAVNESQWENEGWPYWEGQEYEENWEEGPECHSHGYDGNEDEINALGKGKAKGKGKGGFKGKGKGGFKGSCYTCGQFGHSQRFCPQKGKSKGKGKFGMSPNIPETRNCYHCGQAGHLARNCPAKGQGKGIGSLEGQQGTTGWNHSQGAPAVNWNPGQPWPGVPQQPVNTQQAPQGNAGMDLGGSMSGGIHEVSRDGEEWNVVARKARSRFDMRPTRGLQEVMRGVNHIEREASAKEINGMDKYRGNWERIWVTADSGAADSVTGRDTAEAIPVKETEASRNGMNYRAANGSVIANYGEKELKGYNGQGGAVNMVLQVADVTKTLGSVPQWAEADNLVVFDKGKDGKSASYIFNKKTKAVTEMEYRNGAYGFDMWVPRGKAKQSEMNTGKFHALMVEKDDEEDEQGFSGLGRFF